MGYEGDPISITLYREKGKLGVSVIGGYDHALRGVFVQDVKPSCVSEPPLQVGDQIVAVNGTGIFATDHEEALTCFVGQTLNLVVIRFSAEQWTTRESIIANREIAEKVREQVESVHGTNGLGFVLFAPQNKTGLFVQKVIPGMEASIKGLVDGEEIVEVDGKDLTGVKSFDEGRAIFQELGDSFSLKIRGADLVERTVELKRN